MIAVGVLQTLLIHDDALDAGLLLHLAVTWKLLRLPASAIGTIIINLLFWTRDPNCIATTAIHVEPTRDTRSHGVDSTQILLPRRCCSGQLHLLVRGATSAD